MTYQENQMYHRGIFVSLAATLTFSLGTKSFKGESGSKANVVGVLAGRALRFFHGFPEKFIKIFQRSIEKMKMLLIPVRAK